MTQRYWDDVREGDRLGPVEFPLSFYRLVMIAGAVRDYSPIHHNQDVARAQGARDVFANNTSLFVMWERVIRDYIGLDGTIVTVRGFRMGSFNLVGETLVVSGSARRKWTDEDSGRGMVELTVQTEISGELTVGPGTVVVTLPRR